jgi:hypothetical protein
MKKLSAFAAAAAFCAGAAPLFSQYAPQASPPPSGPEPRLGVTPSAGARLHDPNAEVEAQRMPTPGGPQDRRPLAPSKDAAHQGSARVSEADGTSVDAVLAALYASVSHDEASSPNWERMRGIFLQVGMLIPPKNPRSDLFTVLDVDGFEQRVKESIVASKAKGDPTSFFEKEIARRTDCFGNVCQVFSTYESRRAPSDEKPFVRGINSIQLVNDGHRWWIASVAWDQERPDNPIPPQYLPNSVPSEYLKK